MLQRIGWYLLGHLRVVMCMNWRAQPSVATIHTDSDWAGCVRPARSTSSSIIAIDQHVGKKYLQQQRVFALSNADAEQP